MSASTDDGRGRWATLVSFERRMLARSTAPWLIVSLFALTTVVAALNGRDHVRRHDAAVGAAASEAERVHAEARRDIARLERERAVRGIPWSRLQPGLPSAPAVEARIHDFRAGIPPLATAVVSLSHDVLPQRYGVRSGERFSPFTRTIGTGILSGVFPERPTDNPSALEIGGFDLAFVAVFLYPLLTIALTYDVVSTDREAGTLELVSSQPISFGRWLGARLIVRAALVLTCGVFLPTIVVAMATPVPWSPDSSVRLVIWSTALLAYASFWFAIGVVTSARAATTAVSVVMAVSAWLLLVAIIPAIVSRCLPLLASTETTATYVSAERDASLTINPRVDAAVTALNRLLRDRLPAATDPGRDDLVLSMPVTLPVGADLLGVLPESTWPRRMTAPQLMRALADARRTLFEAALGDIVLDLDRGERRERAIFAIARFASPALLLQEIADDVAGTGWRRWSAVVGALDAYLRERRSFFTAKILAADNVSADELARLGPFRPPHENSIGVVSRSLLPLAGICAVPAALAFGWARGRFTWPAR